MHCSNARLMMQSVGTHSHTETLSLVSGKERRRGRAGAGKSLTTASEQHVLFHDLSEGSDLAL